MTSPVVSFGDDDAHAHPLNRDVHPSPSSAFPSPTGDGIPSPRDRRPSASQVPPPVAAVPSDDDPPPEDEPPADATPEPPEPPKKGGGKKSQDGAQPVNRLARLLAAVSTQERKDRIHRFRDDYAVKNDGDYTYVILAGGEYVLEMTENSVKVLQSTFTEGARTIAQALNTVDVPRVGEQIAERAAPLFAARIDEAADRYIGARTGESRRKWGFLYGLLLGAAVAFGAAFDHDLDVGHYRERYNDAIAAVPRLQALLKRPAGEDAMKLLEVNGDEALRGLTTCSAAYGLQSVKSRAGDSVCVGSAKATFGFRTR